ncbi:MAG: sensor histidine kinase [Candidatus Sericytochromatia bacterium]
MAEAPFVQSSALNQRVQKTLSQERQDVITWLNWIRLMGVTFWFFYSYSISLRPSYAQSSTGTEVPYLCAYLVISILILGAGYRFPLMRKVAYLSIALIDIPLVFVMRYQAMHHSVYPDSSMNFTLAIFIMLIACNFLTLEPKAIIGSALMVAILQSYLQYDRAIANQDWAWWSIIPILIILLITALTSVYATRRLLGMVYQVAQEQEAIQAQQIANIQLENKVDFLNQLATNLSHDLKSPLSSCYNTVQIMLITLQKKPLVDKAWLQQHLKKIIHSINKLNQYIAMSLDRDMLELGKLVLRQEAIDLRQVCEGVLELHSDYASRAEISTILELPDQKFWIKGDGMRFEHVLSNLVSNGLRYARHELRLEARFEDSSLILQVRDDGEGMTAEALSSLFERYASSQDTSKPANSTGLGLAICKSYIEMMNGGIRVESIPGKETVISLQMPLWHEQVK